MPGTEENEQRIAGYLDGKMDAAAEKSFMNELEGDIVLKKQFEEEVFLRSLLEDASSPADILSGALLKKDELQQKSLEIHLFRFRNIAAVFLIVIAGAFIYSRFRKKDQITVPVAIRQPAGSNSASVSDQQAGVAALYHKYYTKYTAADDDPVELSHLYQDYRSGRYKSLYAANLKDLAQKGFQSNKSGMQLYLELYKGLAFLDQARLDSALFYLTKAVNAPQENTELSAAADWYLVLAFLANNDMGKAKESAQKIMQFPSSYQAKASALLDDLNKH